MILYEILTQICFLLDLYHGAKPIFQVIRIPETNVVVTNYGRIL